MAPGVFRQLACDMIRRGYTVRFEANGTSMVPTIRDGETLMVEPIAAEGVRLGDVVLCDLGPRLVAHRLVRKRSVNANGEPTQVFHVRGDAPGASVDWIEGSRIVGRVQSVERNGTPQAIRRVGPSRSARLLVLLRRSGAFWSRQCRAFDRESSLNRYRATVVG
jgi:hypothetical protein